MPDLTRIRHTVQIHSNGSGTRCNICGERLHERGGPVAPGINHMLDHGYRLLHVGVESGQDAMGNTVHHTVAILGSTTVP